jgi:hypothetical protein
MEDTPVPSGTERLILIVLTAFSGIKEDATLYGDRIIVVQSSAMISTLLTDNRMTKTSLLLLAAVCLTMTAHADGIPDHSSFAHELIQVVG